MGGCSERASYFSFCEVGGNLIFFVYLKKLKAVVKPDWLRESVEAGHALPCGKYAALEDLINETIIHCPDGDDCTGCKKCKTSSNPPSPSSSTRSPATHRTPPYSTPSNSGISLQPHGAPSSGKLKYSAHYACERAAPLVCPNEDLVKALVVIRSSRELESEGRSMLSYSRAIAVRLMVVI